MRVRPLAVPPPIRLPSTPRFLRASSSASPNNKNDAAENEEEEALGSSNSPKGGSDKKKSNQQQEHAGDEGMRILMQRDDDDEDESEQQQPPDHEDEEQQQQQEEGPRGGHSRSGSSSYKQKKEEWRRKGGASSSSSRRFLPSSPLWSPTRGSSYARLLQQHRHPLELLPDLSSLPLSPSNALKAARTMTHRMEAERHGITRMGSRRLLKGRSGWLSPRRKTPPPAATPGGQLSAIERSKQAAAAAVAGDEEEGGVSSPPFSPTDHQQQQEQAQQDRPGWLSWQSRRRRLKRAYYGTLLSIIERPKPEQRALQVGPPTHPPTHTHRKADSQAGGGGLVRGLLTGRDDVLLVQVLSNYVWPLLEMAIEWLQFSLFNSYVLPHGRSQHSRRISERAAGAVQAVVAFQHSVAYDDNNTIVSKTDRQTASPPPLHGSSSQSSSSMLLHTIDLVC